MKKLREYPFPPGDGRADVPHTLHVIPRVWSPQLRNRRDLVVYLPPSYEEGRTRRYPVLYMHDGQNLFDPATSYAGHWQLGATLSHHAMMGLEVIVVGIPNTGVRRIDEYSPHRDLIRGGGDGDRYVSFLVETVKPMIDRQLRTMRGPDATAVAGSSLGALISLYALFRSPWTFGAAGVLSPALWFADGAIFDVVRNARPPGGRIHLDIGTAEGPDALVDTRRMRDLLAAQGFEIGKSLSYYEDVDARHQERAWARRFRVVLPYLFGGPCPPSAEAPDEAVVAGAPPAVARLRHAR
jgi:predicted alpha/beta superfamily hydrolase